MNDGGVCRTAPATPGLLITYFFSFFSRFLPHCWMVTLVEKFLRTFNGKQISRAVLKDIELFYKSPKARNITFLANNVFRFDDIICIRLHYKV